MTASRIRPWRTLATLALACALAGCGGDDSATAPLPETDPLPPGTPSNDTPAHTLTRFEAAYENQVLASYVALLAADFRFEFSAESDPNLVVQYGLNWGVDDESASTTHLFDGFTNDGGSYVSGAAGITMSLPGAQIVNDPDYPDSVAFYKLAIVPSVSMSFDIPGMDGFEVSAPHDFRLVRGDAAVLLAGQPADSSHWYVRRWTDKSPSLNVRRDSELALAGRNAAIAESIGQIKAMYR